MYVSRHKLGLIQMSHRVTSACRFCRRKHSAAVCITVNFCKLVMHIHNSPLPPLGEAPQSPPHPALHLHMQALMHANANLHRTCAPDTHAVVNNLLLAICCQLNGVPCHVGDPDAQAHIDPGCLEVLNRALLEAA